MNDFELVKSKVEAGKNLFITGGAGSGKSYILRRLKLEYGPRLHLTASTGISALNIGGLTVHSYARLGVGKNHLDTIIKRIRRDKKVESRLLKVEILAIDEISMLSAKMLSLLNGVLQRVRRSFLPFGGVQILMFGDFLQLPPILDEEGDAYALGCDVWEDAGVETILLRGNYRQSADPVFYDLLSSLRFGEYVDEVYEALKPRVGLKPEARAVKLVSHRFQAFEINAARLRALVGEVRKFNGKAEGEPEAVQAYSKQFADIEVIELKKGARVMLTFNVNIEQGLVNGALGEVTGFAPNGHPIVQFDALKLPVTIGINEWVVEEPGEGGGSRLFSFKQIPLVLAYAVTIHKAQGLTFDCIHTDISRCFAEGQAYVSLSRVKTLEGLFLDPFPKSVFRSNPQMVEYYKGLLAV